MPAPQVEAAVQRRHRREGEFATAVALAVPASEDVDRRVPVRVEDAAVLGEEPTALTDAAERGLRPAVHAARVVR